MTALVIYRGDITALAVDAVVNAANTTLMGGRGVDGAIHRAGGPAILEECKKLREEKYRLGLPTGKAVSTTAGNLPARWVIHTVGPVFFPHELRRHLLENCYRNSFALARELGARSIAFPTISAGVYGWPVNDATQVAVEVLHDELSQHPEPVEKVYLVAFSDDVEAGYRAALEK